MQRIRIFLTLILCPILALGVWSIPRSALAAPLTGMADTLSSTVAGKSGVTHTIYFTSATGATLEQIDIQFATTGGGTTKPAHLGLGSVGLGTVTGLNAASWSLDTSNASSGLLSLTSAGDGIGSSVAITIPLTGITNSNNGDCQPSDPELDDTCAVNITTYSDAGITTVDSGSTTYTVAEDANLTFTVDGVASGSTHNGVTATGTTTATTLSFGSFTPGDVKYLTHKLTITTNAPDGFTVYAVLADRIEGQTSHQYISPFGATNATWTTPQSWTTPTGVTPGVDTGWFGANTSDTSVTGWSSGTSGKFGPLGSNMQPVAFSSGPELSGKDVYVSYALGINSAQPADAYSGSITYIVEPSY